MKDKTILYTLGVLLAAGIGFLVWRGFADLGDVREADSKSVTSPAPVVMKPDPRANPPDPANTSSKPPTDLQPPVAPSPPDNKPGFGRRGGREGLDPPPQPPPP